MHLKEEKLIVSHGFRDPRGCVVTHGFRGCVLLDLLSLACGEVVHPNRVFGKGACPLVSWKEKEGEGKGGGEGSRG